jgi:stearoyl-CoA desaturase (delta-9 desaturase)
LSPRGYAILHRMHHAYSDTAKDPHSPENYSNVFTMMLATKHRYDAFAYRREEPEPRFDGGFPDWPLIDRIGQNWAMRLLWGAAYTSVYLAFAPSVWWFLLLPAHFIMGPIHGAIVNWCGHRYGYRNYESDDVSRNMLPFDFLTAGELFQNNHHEFSMSPKFAARCFEVDPTYYGIVALDALGVIKIATDQRARYPLERKAPVLAASDAE